MLCLLALWTILVDVPQAVGQETLNIGLLRFDAIPTEEGIRLEWDVETELGTAGYTLKRGENGVFDYLSDPSGSGNLFIFAEGGPAQGYSYSFLDQSAVREKTYTYQLIEITTSSLEQVQGEETVAYSITPTPTPITFTGGIGGPGGGGNQNITGTPTASPSPTVTPRPQSTATNGPPPTVVAPTALPSPTIVRPTTAPLSSAPLQPTAAPLPTEAYPEPASSITTVDDQSVPSESLPLPDVTAAQEMVSQAAETLISEAYPAPAAQAADTSAGIAGAIVISGDLHAANKQQPVVQPANGAPIVIAAAANPLADELPFENSQAQITNEEPVDQDSNVILLWVAFIVAVVVFTASVVGAVMLYSRRRPS